MLKKASTDCLPSLNCLTDYESATYAGEDIINIRTRDLSKVSKKYLKHLTQTAIHFCLDGRDLASRDIFKRITS